MQRNKFLRSAVAGIALLLVGAGASVAHAAPPEPPAPVPVPTITTLPLLGVQLTVDVTTGPGGALSSVAVNPADGLTATTVKPNKVVFVNEDGTAKVYVRGRDGGQRVEVRAGALGDVSGDGGWSGDVFGNGTVTTVGFTIGATTDGGPDITNVTTSDPTAVIGATEYGTGEDHEGHHDDDDDEVVLTATSKVTFTNGGQSRTLAIRASVRTDEDGTTSARVGVSLGKLRGVAQPVDVAVGAKTWTGLLCDGSTATINYTVNADGSITDVTATPEPDRIKTDGDRRIEVRFSGDERVSIRVSVSDAGITVNIDEKIRCEDAPDPSVNTPTSTNPDDDDDHDGHDDDDDDDHGDDHGGGHGDDHGDREHD
ncbi:MAG: hypothetical protein ABMA25_19460 [Ilumatobacteraceae bacterium]